jgi:hypothetical protein
MEGKNNVYSLQTKTDQGFFEIFAAGVKVCWYLKYTLSDL